MGGEQLSYLPMCPPADIPPTPLTCSPGLGILIKAQGFSLQYHMLQCDYSVYKQTGYLLLRVLLGWCMRGRWPRYVGLRRCLRRFIKPAWLGRGPMKVSHLQTSISYSPQPAAQGKECSSLPEVQSPCKAIFLLVTDFRNRDQEGKVPGACLFRLGCLATKGGPDSRRDF